MKESLGVILGIIGLLMMLGGITWTFYLIHPVCALIFCGICLFTLGSVIMEDKL